MSMRVLFLFCLLLMSPKLGSARDPEKVELWRLEQFLVADWKALSFGFERSHGDYYSIDQSIVLQRLPDGTVSLSFIKDGQHDLPVVKRILPIIKAQEIQRAVGDFHRKVLGEVSMAEWVDTHKGDERLALMKKHFPHGYQYTVMALRITKSEGKTVGLSKNFDESKDTLKEFTAYFDDLLKQ
jgi:hypothetical protein